MKCRTNTNQVEKSIMDAARNGKFNITLLNSEISNEAINTLRSYNYDITEIDNNLLVISWEQ